MALSPTQIKELREQTGAGMMDCKKALTESDGDMEKAIEWLRVKGLSKAAKKSSRTAAEGLVACEVRGNTAVIVEVNTETDFVARNEKFQTFVKDLLPLIDASADTADALAQKAYTAEQTISEHMTHLISVIGENIVLRRVGFLTVNPGVIMSYTHGAVSPNMGRIGVLVALESTADPKKLAELGELLAMHIAAARPLALLRDEITSDQIEKEKTVFRLKSLESGAPEAAIEKIVENRVNKYFQEVVLSEQTYMLDNKKTIKDVLADAEKDLGVAVKIAAFKRFELGEGIEKETGDFAAEVSLLTS